MRKILSLLICIFTALALSTTCFAEAETTFSEEYCTTTEYGTIVFMDEADLLTDIEENYVKDAISNAINEKHISVGVISTAIVKQETADLYYSLIAENDNNFALLLFNDSSYEFFFYGSAVEEFANDEDAFWMTDSYFDSDFYFAAALQFPLDIQYHTVHETIPVETTTAETEDILPENYFTEIAANGIHTAKLENGYKALLHDLDNSLTEDEEAIILKDLMKTVRDKDFNIGIVITDDIGSDKSDYGVMDFTDVYYEDYCGKNTDGILLLINNDNKYDWISTSGGCIDMFHDIKEDIFDALYDYLVDGNYNLACQRFVQEVKYYSEQEYVHYDDYDYYFDDEETEGIFSLLFVSLFVAIIAVAIYAGIINTGYKMKTNVTAANYKLANSLSFSENSDTFIRTYTTRRTVSSSSSGSRSRSGGGSRSSGRSHRSSGGGRHGGGGRRR